MTNPDSSVFTGQFENGLKQGMGKIVNQNGNITQGYWKNDKYHSNISDQIKYLEESNTRL